MTRVAANVEHYREARNGSDRVCAIVYAAAVEDVLRHALTRLIIRHDGHTDKLKSFDGPLGNWGLMNDFAHAIGLISEDVWNDLDLVRRIRNTFAHKGTISDSKQKPQRVTFSSDTNKDCARNLKLPEIMLHPDAAGKALAPLQDPRERFSWTCDCLMNLLARAENHCIMHPLYVGRFDYQLLSDRYLPDRGQ